MGDTKLISYGNVVADHGSHDLHRPASKAYVDVDGLRAANDMDLVDVDYVAQGDRAKPVEQRGRYRVGEDTWAMSPAKGHKGEAIVLRRVRVVLRRRRRRRRRQGPGQKARPSPRRLDALSRGLGNRHYPSADKVSARLAVIAAKRERGDAPPR